ncbi:hypothetical protein SAMN02745824_1028 [Parasphingorhabdus marina DSM 22363]|uniref:Uncharacterized protein n=1 Tax=Parasphingorhabdus marina DSM 22363 TaxID=1123272 RepID=A0A1N6CUL7_9SPHN|nr:hypothetical protein [Parasphingorhabdus marina]SIN62203.1 hypothetical protein SAMN02745824_1028 [Parasphingorhabdus marina DSM 22363]
MMTGMTVVLLLAGANLADEGCGISCVDRAEEREIARSKTLSSGAECGAMTLQFKVGGKIREKQQQVCEIRVKQR